MVGGSRPATGTSLPWQVRGVLPAIVAPPEAHGRGARAKPVAVRSHAVARRAALGTEAVCLLEPAFYGLGSVGHPARAVAPPTGKIALGVPVTAHGGYRRSGGRRRRLPPPRRARRRSRRTPGRPCRRGGAGARERSGAPPRSRHEPRTMGARRVRYTLHGSRVTSVVKALRVLACRLTRGAVSLSSIVIVRHLHT
jgi:hypothetical protein